VVAVGPGLGVAQGCTDLPRLGSNSYPPCLPCQVGADCTVAVPDEAAEQTVEAAASFAGIEYLWVVPGASRLSGGTDQGCLRPVRSRRVDGTSTLGDDATAAVAAAHGYLPALDTPERGDHSSGLTVVCPGRSSVLWLLGPCVP
jgi:hypothetical protein